MPEISVLIPAYRPDYLDLAIASVLAQTFRDFELLISDDSDGTDVEEVVGRWADPRIAYVRNPRRWEPGANRDHLVSLAQGRFLKFVFHDDFLLPHSLEVLHHAALTLQAKMAFHPRVKVDEVGRVLRSESPIAQGSVGALDPSAVFRQLIPLAYNFIGEPSNILLDAMTLQSMHNPFGIGDDRMRFLTDVALYVNLAEAGHRIAAVGLPLSAFRVHGGQVSAAGGNYFSAGMFEWEMLDRWAADHGHLPPEAATSAIDVMRRQYAPHVVDFPELQAFLSVPSGPDPSGRFLTPGFRSALEAGWEAVDHRHRARQAAA